MTMASTSAGVVMWSRETNKRKNKKTYLSGDVILRTSDFGDVE